MFVKNLSCIILVFLFGGKLSNLFIKLLWFFYKVMCWVIVKIKLFVNFVFFKSFFITFGFICFVLLVILLVINLYKSGKFDKFTAYNYYRLWDLFRNIIECFKNLYVELLFFCEERLEIAYNRLKLWLKRWYEVVKDCLRKWWGRWKK